MKPFYPLLCCTLVLLAGVAAGQQSADPPSYSPSAVSPSPVPQPDVTPPTPAERDPLLDVPPLPTGKVTLVGGTIKSLDRVRDRMVVQPFGGGALRVSFDERTHIYRDGVETTQLGIKKGDRVYVDTMLDGPRVFARNIRVESEATPADSAGQVLSFNPANGILKMRDDLSAQPVTFRVGQNTVLTHQGQKASLADLKPGALIAVKFAPFRANSGSARAIEISAIPGTVFTFEGRVTNIDLRTRTLSVNNIADNKTYDITFNPKLVDRREALGVGAHVKVEAVFRGSSYVAETVSLGAGKQ